MFKRRLVQVGLALGFVLLVTAPTLVFHDQPDPISKQTCDRIEAGMTKDEVAFILGNQPTCLGGVDTGSYEILWIAPDGASASVFFDFDHKTVGKAQFLPAPPRSLFACLRSWFGW